VETFISALMILLCDAIADGDHELPGRMTQLHAQYQEDGSTHTHARLHMPRHKTLEVPTDINT
jgi:hypothetical protein